MKIKKEEEDHTEEKKIKKEEGDLELEEQAVVVESSLFRASLSLARFANPSGSASTRPPGLLPSTGTNKRRPGPSPDPGSGSNPNPPHPSSATLTVTVTVARPIPLPLPLRKTEESNNDDRRELESVVGPGTQAQAQTQAQTQGLRRSSRKRKRNGHFGLDAGETRLPPGLDTDTGDGDGDDGGGDTIPTRPSKKKTKTKMKKKRRRVGGDLNLRARELDHLPNLGALPEYLAEDLDVLFCGINPGRTSATVGHHYANGTNHFWPCLHLSGFTPRQLSANEDSTLPEVYNLGLTNLVERASISEAHLLNREMADSVPALLAKIARWRPRVICFNGKGIWLHVERSLHQQQLNQSYGSDDDNGSSSVVVVPKREELKPIIADKEGQERPVKTELVAVARSPLLQQQPPPKKDTSNDGVATRSRVATLKREEEECKPSVADTDQGRSMRTRRERPASGEGASHAPTTANSSNLDAGRVTFGRGGSELPSPSSPVTPRRVATTTQSTFVYGIQPYKAIHDVKNATVRETLFCVFPSSSGRVVSHQRKDKVVLFKKLREELELIKAGTFDTSSMQLVSLVRQGS